MLCTICKTGRTHKGHTTVTLNRGDSTIVLKQVPAEICDNCSEYYLDELTSQKVYEMTNQAFLKGAEVEIARYAV